MIDFIIENYKLLLFLAYIICDILLILLILFKNKKVNPVVEKVLLALPSIICKVETKLGAGTGDSKKSLVLDAALSFYKDLTGLEISKSSDVAKIFSDAIEDILSTPQKKGD